MAPSASFGRDSEEKAKLPADRSGIDGECETPSVSSDGDERGTWGNHMEFFLSCLGFAVGLGNVWRFPYLCYRNGGGAFLIPYVFFLVFAGVPMFFLELSFGQFAGTGPITIWRVAPMFKGVGFAMVMISFLVCIYYNVIISYILHYLFASFTSVLPWITCTNDYNTDDCVEGGQVKMAFEMYKCNNIGGDYFNGTCFNATMNATAAMMNETLLNTNFTRVSPTEEYWKHFVLQISDGIDDMGGISWSLTLCNLLGWIVVFFSLVKGVKSSGKVVYFTATFPYIVLFILLIRGLTLDGAMDGVWFYIKPDWSRLAHPKVWMDAAVQIFYSLGAAWGSLITMSSYNRFNNNCYRDALIISVSNCATSVFAGFVIFSVIGFMAHEIGVPVGDVIDQGPGLAFVAYPEAVSLLPISPLWAILFFFMLFTLGLDSQFGMLEAVLSGLIDEFPTILRPNKTWFTLAICVLQFLLALPMVSQGGIYLLTMVDWYSAGVSLMIVAVTECLVLAWLYGCDRFYDNIKMMLGSYPSIWWKICWKVITPVVLLGILLFTMVNHSPVTYGKYEYPGWADSLGWLMAMASVVNIPVFAIISLVQAKGTFMERLRAVTQPTAEWGPALNRDRDLDLSEPELNEKGVPVIDIVPTKDEEKIDLSKSMERISTV
ncbi:SLC6A5 [Branchiostoma lanceolatum]|uniref:Transporter n=1 Tax=Branchiostoma lanceolatum TaxID=7740 RepID=A0A8K0A567_BRALA|nr:SLC6A5 [Branchiostoma lanceolatum]